MGRPDGVARPPEVAAMFARIAPRYDLMNRLMTFGMDGAWRKRAVRIATGGPTERALDIGAGTGDLALELSEKVQRVIGVDFCEPMLAQGRVKVRETANVQSVTLLPADALRLPFADESFDCVTSAFTVRNIPDVLAAFREMVRVLRPGGRVVCLELSPLRSGANGASTLSSLKPRLLRGYFHRVVPAIGAVVSGDGSAYRYLPASVDRFPAADALARLMEQAGLTHVSFRLLNFGTVAMHDGSK